MKKLLVWIVVLGVLGIGGYFAYGYVFQFAANKVFDTVVDQMLADEEVQRLLDDPEIQRLIETELDAATIEQIGDELADAAGGLTPEELEAAAGGVGSGQAKPGASVQVIGKEEAARMVMDKFSIDEIRTYAGMAAGGLTEQDKETLQREVLDKFTPEELEALKIAALVEAQKRAGR